jgi:hypothetical protein
MRNIILVLGVVSCAGFGNPAQADPYRWCAEYGGRSGGGTNCGFVTFQQCRAAISGLGGFCRRNAFYDGRRDVIPEETYGRSERRRYRY